MKTDYVEVILVDKTLIDVIVYKGNYHLFWRVIWRIRIDYSSITLIVDINSDLTVIIRLIDEKRWEVT